MPCRVGDDRSLDRATLMDNSYIPSFLDSVRALLSKSPCVNEGVQPDGYRRALQDTYPGFQVGSR
jgi:hypothetical protein